MKYPLKVAAWSGLISFVLSIVVLIYMFSVEQFGSTSAFGLLISLSAGVLGILFLNGFLVLGKKFNGKLLVVMTWIGIAFAVLSMIFGIFGSFADVTPGVQAQQIGASTSGGTNFDGEFGELVGALLLVVIIIWAIFTLILGAYSILFGIGLLKLKDKVQYSRVAGILEIVAGATYIILIGFLVRMVATVFEIAMMFKASEKYEK